MNIGNPNNARVFVVETEQGPRFVGQGVCPKDERRQQQTPELYTTNPPKAKRSETERF